MKDEIKKLEELKNENEKLKHKLEQACLLIERDDFKYVQPQNVMIEINGKQEETNLDVGVPSITESLKTNFWDIFNA